MINNIASFISPSFHDEHAPLIRLFERKPGIKRDWLTEFFRANMAMRPNGSVIVYPEGTRNTKKDFLPLKTGVFECAWNLKVIVFLPSSPLSFSLLGASRIKYI